MPGLPPSLPGAIASLGLAAAAAAAVPVIRPTVVAVHPHDTAAFTQGLVYTDGVLYESTGNYGASDVRRVDLASGQVLQSVPLPSTEFGEGLALVGDELHVLTWRERVGHVYTKASLGHVRDFFYTGFGWGLAYDGTRLVMSDGSSTLRFRDPGDFREIGRVEVRKDGVPVVALNELECVGKLVYANVWETDSILRIDLATGTVLTEIDASGLLTPAEKQAADVLNGIAFDPVTSHFFLTGKWWPHVFEVTLPIDPGGTCEPPRLAAIRDLHAVRGGPGGVALGWTPDPSAPRVHVNAVERRADLAGNRPHRPGLAGGVGEPRCDVGGGAGGCTDLRLLQDARPLLYLKAYRACGPTGLDEGP